MFKPPKGTRDLEPDDMILRDKIIEKIKEIFERYGYLPLITPAFEELSTLTAKGGIGPEAVKQIYSFKDKAERELGLIYDLTVPLVRYITTNPDIKLPFKRYQISRVWRYEDISKGRYREFWQADIDIVGSSSMLADSEIIACAIDAFKNIGFKNFIIRLNNRKILSALIEYAGVDKNKIEDVLRTIDKFDKIGRKGVEEELLNIRKINKVSCDKILELIEIKGKPKDILKKAENIIKDIKIGIDGIKELNEIIFYLEKMEAIDVIKIDFSLARGLDYYTGPIFEVFIEENIGSLAGGGRYDKMIGLFSKKDIPAVGISLGLDRIVEIVKEKKIFELPKTNIKVFVIPVNKNLIPYALEISQKIRKEKINCIIDLMNRKLSKNFEYANSQKIPFVIIIGEKEIKQNKLRLRDMVTGKEELLDMKDIIKKLK
ncbi:MAG: histidine--tRNA ligase [Candidatus Aenigmarchaeota archaeon]|nr:histidine--tRNA ligase [Candidatus Aenigmarchaeota archaeon]